MRRITFFAMFIILVLLPPAFAAETVRFERPDGAVLQGTLRLATTEGKSPAVLLIHQAQRSQSEFDFLQEDLLALGFHTLTIDLRGHGDSTKPDTLDRAFFMKLFRDPEFAPPDVFAILHWLREHERVDGDRIAAMGGSVGANLSYIATGISSPVRTAISLSGNAEAVADLSSRIEGFSPRSVLLLAADNDHGRDAYARTMFEQAGDPKRLEILEGSSAHGTDLLRESEDFRRIVLQWLQAQLK